MAFTLAEGASHCNLLPTKVKFAFTLAEILITLGVIGVVAAMTIPTLIANTNSQKYRSQFKKAISTLSNAARMNNAQYGFDFAGIDTVCGSDGETHKPDTNASICAILNANLQGATYYAKASDIKTKKGTAYTIDSPYINQFTTSNLSNANAYVLSDGTIFAFHRLLGKYPCDLPIGMKLQDTYLSGTTDFLSGCYGFIDVNGTELPNKEVSCTTGRNSLAYNDCIVKNDSKSMTDIIPLRIHNGIVEPTTAAGRYILKTAK